MDILNTLKIASTGLTGLIAGGALFVNIDSIPSLKKVKNDDAVLEYWKELISTEKWQMLALVPMVTSGMVDVLDKSDKRDPWLVGTLLLAINIPLTLFLMNPDRDMLFEDKVVRRRGGKWVRTKIESWNKKHMYRSLIFFIVFGLFLYAQWSEGSHKEDWMQNVNMNIVLPILTKIFGWYTKGIGGQM